MTPTDNPPQQKPPRRILIVDDDDDTLLVLRTLLTGEGYTVDAAAGGEEALEQVARQIPDVVILDIMMPGLNGAQMARKLKANPKTASIPLIMLTALSEKKYMHAALFELDVDFYITKPFDHEDLLDKVRQAIRFRRLPPHAGQNGS